MKRKRLFTLRAVSCLLLAALLVSAVPVSAASTSTQVVQNAQRMFDEICSTYGDIAGYVRMLNTNKFGYEQTLNEADYYNQVYDAIVDFGSAGMSIICGAVGGGLLEAAKAAGEEAMEALLDSMMTELPKLTLEEYVFSLAKQGDRQASLYDLMEIGFRIEDDFGGKISSVSDAVEFIAAVQNIKMGFAAMKMGRDFYMAQLRASPWDALWRMAKTTTLEYVGEAISANFGGAIGSEFLDGYAYATTAKTTEALLRTVAGAINNEFVNAYAEELIRLMQETEELISFEVDDYGKTPSGGGQSAGENQPSGGGQSSGGGNQPSGSGTAAATYVENRYYCHPTRVFVEGYYTGEWRDGAPNGYGRIEFRDVNGDGKRYSISTDAATYYALSYEGGFSGGLRVGDGTQYYEGGYKDVGTFYGAWEAGKTVFDGKLYLKNERNDGYWPKTTVAKNSNAGTSTYGAWVSTAPKATYTVAYDANGGSGAPAAQTKKQGEALTLSGTAPTRSGYTFGGWATSSGGSAAYWPGSVYSADANLTLYAVWQKTAVPSPAFTDVRSGSYYADAVGWAVEKGITQGTGKATFSPNRSCTRGQAVTFLWRAAGCPEVGMDNPFSDVRKGNFFYKAVLWAKSENMISGTGAHTFSPNTPISRADFATMLYRFAGSPRVSGKPPFADVPAGKYYSNAVTWCAAEGITSGVSKTRFEPKGTCSRAQIVTFLYRYDQQ